MLKKHPRVFFAISARHYRSILLDRRGQQQQSRPEEQQVFLVHEARPELVDIVGMLIWSLEDTHLKFGKPLRAV